jgi:hypothetical protein
MKKPYCVGQVWHNHKDNGKIYLTQIGENSFNYLSFGTEIRGGLEMVLDLENGVPPKSFGNISILEKHRFTNNEKRVRDFIAVQAENLQTTFIESIKETLNQILLKLPPSMIKETYRELADYTENMAETLP